MQQMNTNAFVLTYNNNILTATVKERAVIDQMDIKEFLNAAKKLVNGENFVVLTDARAPHIMLHAAQEILKSVQGPNRLASAIVTNDGVNEKRVDSYISSHTGVSSTKHFSDTVEALNWLNSFIIK